MLLIFGGDRLTGTETCNLPSRASRKSEEACQFVTGWSRTDRMSATRPPAAS
jgi:hypothetical protein